MNESNATYRSYLLRLWQNSPTAIWHASIQDVQSSEIVHCANMETLVAFIFEQTESSLPTNNAHSDKEDHATK